MKNRNWNKEHDYKWQWILAGVFVLILMLFGNDEGVLTIEVFDE